MILKAPARAAIACLCLLALPPLTIAQSAGNPSVTPPSPAVATADLPDAPAPAIAQSGQGSQSQNGQPKPKSSAPRQTQPNPGSQLSLGDLGFTPAQTHANAQLQARLNKRTHMLKIHQTLGLITVAPMLATVIVSSGAKQKHSNVPGVPPTEPSSSGVALHAALGSVTVAMYSATAYYAIFAPKIPGVKPRGAIRLHRDLAFIHAPGMVLTPILGAMALNQENQGEKVHGIASIHSDVAWTTVIAYGAAIVAVSWPIHWKFWEHR